MEIQTFCPVSISLKRLGKPGSIPRPERLPGRAKKATIGAVMNSAVTRPQVGLQASSAKAPSRRSFLKAATAAAASLLPARTPWAQSGAYGASSPSHDPDFTIAIAEIEWELSPKRKIRTAAYNGRIPGTLLRVHEGKPVTIELRNQLDRPEIVHWHGQWIPSNVDGSTEEGTPMIGAQQSARITFTPRPTGLHWYHTHSAAHRDLKRALYSGQFGVLLVESRENPGLYDQEQFIVLNDWDAYFVSSDDGSQMVNYVAASINGRMLGHDDPMRVRQGERVLFHILNASATQAHWLVLPGHSFQVIALDGRPVPTQAKVDVLRLGPAERITAVVTMDAPGVWILGEARSSFREAGMGTIVEYANATGKPQARPQTRLEWDYRVFGDAQVATYKPDITIPLVFSSRFEGHGAFDRWMINGKSFPETDPIVVHQGLRHRLIFDNRSTDDHPVHLHRHAFELVTIRNSAASGMRKDVVIVEAGTKLEADLVADNPGATLFHCHQQDHMDSGFMALVRYA
jgi:FtsP/CotA-like multicopper oxidase with cupredoxin domain